MDEEEFDALTHLRPLEADDVMRTEAQARRSTALGVALWGRSSADLQRQLLARYPEIPSGFVFCDFWNLLRSTERISEGLADPRRAWLRPFARSSATISAGTQQFTVWEARCEIVHRAIQYLESR